MACTAREIGTSALQAVQCRWNLRRNVTGPSVRPNARSLVEPPVRIELTTFRLQGGRSTTELRRQVAGVYRGTDDGGAGARHVHRPPVVVSPSSA